MTNEEIESLIRDVQRASYVVIDDFYFYGMTEQKKRIEKLKDCVRICRDRGLSALQERCEAAMRILVN